MSCKKMFFWTTHTYYMEDMPYQRTYFKGEHVLLEDIYYWRTCLLGICFTGGLVLLDKITFCNTLSGEQVSIRTFLINYSFTHLFTYQFV